MSNASAIVERERARTFKELVLGVGVTVIASIIATKSPDYAQGAVYTAAAVSTVATALFGLWREFSGRSFESSTGL